MKNKKKFVIISIFAFFLLWFVLILNSFWQIYSFKIAGSNRTFQEKIIVTLASFYDASLIVKNSFLSLLDIKQLEPSSEIKTIRLELIPGSIEEMAKTYPANYTKNHKFKKEYLKGKMLYPDGTWKKISYRFRGRNKWHWHPTKPSLRIKLDKDNPINLQNHINLINPEDKTSIGNYYGELMAKKMGVLSHHTEMVRVFINNSYYGLYQMTTRNDENMLRINSRIPGPIFTGDHLGELWKSNQFEITGETKKLEPELIIKDMVDFINQPPSDEKYKK